MAIDFERIAATVVDSYLRQSPPQHDEQPARQRRRRLGGAGSVALGAALGLGAHAAYRRVRRIDPLRVATAVERRLRG
jgi:hypothetical protein